MPALRVKHRVSTVYGHLARFYDTLRPLFAGPPSVTEAALETLDLPPEGRVLDVACGTGFGVRRVLGEDRLVHGLDITRELLTEARRQPDLDDAAFVQGDAERLPYDAGTFDVVTSIGAIQHFPDPDAALADARRVARPGGRLFLVSPRRPTHRIGAWLADRLFFTTTPAELTARLEHAGWTDVEHDTIPIDWTGRSLLATTARRPQGPESSGESTR